MNTFYTVKKEHQFKENAVPLCLKYRVGRRKVNYAANHIIRVKLLRKSNEDY